MRESSMRWHGFSGWQCVPREACMTYFGKKLVFLKVFNICSHLKVQDMKKHTHLPLVRIWAQNMKNQRCSVEWNLSTCNKMCRMPSACILGEIDVWVNVWIGEMAYSLLKCSHTYKSYFSQSVFYILCHVNLVLVILYISSIY